MEFNLSVVGDDWFVCFFLSFLNMLPLLIIVQLFNFCIFMSSAKKKEILAVLKSVREARIT